MFYQAAVKITPIQERQYLIAGPHTTPTPPPAALKYNRVFLQHIFPLTKR